ncbi:hypothetical protein Pelo_4927 [Pelomyxa schiedti]|nr:hypothetical protein Pelo_4927 [Pelomyxa schiedti]
MQSQLHSNNNSGTSRTGSEFNYVDVAQFDVRYLCSVCKSPANIPVLHDCAACLCCACSIKVRVCPVCEEDLEGRSKAITVKTVLLKLASIPVYCPVCKNVVPRDYLDEHIANCPIECLNKCGIKVSPRNQELHNLTECLAVFVRCEQCNDLIQRKSLQDLSHKQLDCPVNCENQCGKRVRPRDIPQHNATTCTMMIVRCTMPQFCTWSGRRCEQNAHLESCLLAKLSPVLNSLIDENKTLYKILEESNRQNEESAQQLEEKYRRREAEMVSKISVLEFRMSKLLGNVFPEGIMMDAPVQILQGWTLHYMQPYSHCTQPSNIDPGQGEWVLIASQLTGTDLLSLCAIGRREEVCHRTTSSTTAQLHRGTYWYFVEGKSFGFSPTARLHLSAADICDNDGPDRRLCWCLNGRGGWRSGRALRGVEQSTPWLKLVYWA